MANRLLRKIPKSLVSQRFNVAVRCLASEAGSETMPLTFGSPQTAYYHNVDVKQVDVPSGTGTFGILPNHVPTLAVLRPGVVTVFEDEGTKKFFVSSGTVTINEDSSLQVLAEEAVLLEQLDMSEARQGLDSAQNAAATATSEEDKAEALIAAECYEAIIKALETH